MRSLKVHPNRDLSPRDVLTPVQRALCMSRNRGRDTKPELILRKACWAEGMRYRLHAKLPGRPDFVVPKYRLAVFVDGCFWHGCATHYQQPATRSEFWADKLQKNRRRDLIVNDQLREAGWAVMRIWEHTIREDLEAAVADIWRRCSVQR